MLKFQKNMFGFIPALLIFSSNLFASSDQDIKEVIRARAEYVQEFRDTYIQDETISGIFVLPIFYACMD